jgi:hypothetical protein
MARNGFIYFLRCGNFVKIGFSDQPEARQRELETGNPHEIILVGCHPGTIELEQRLHRYFQAHHHRGEWFRWCPDIERVANMGLPALITLPRFNVRLGIINKRDPDRSPFSIRRWLQGIRGERTAKPVRLVDQSASGRIFVPKEGRLRRLDALDGVPKSREEIEEMAAISPRDALAAHLDALKPGECCDLASRCGISTKQAANALLGRPVATIPFLRISIATDFDPFPELPHERTPLGDFDFAAFATAFRLTRGILRLSERSSARFLNVSAATICRLENADPMFIGVILRACRFIGVHPFAYIGTATNVSHGKVEKTAA